MSNEQQYRKARDAALRLLTHRPRSENEIQTRLNIRFPDQVVQRVLKVLREQSLVDDEEFARLWTENRNKHSPRSAFAIQRELISKGLPVELAESTVSIINDVDNAYRVGLKICRRLSNANYETFHRRMFTHLQRRGFTENLSKRTTTQLWNEKNGDGKTIH